MKSCQHSSGNKTTTHKKPHPRQPSTACDSECVRSKNVRHILVEKISGKQEEGNQDASSEQRSVDLEETRAEYRGRYRLYQGNNHC